MLDRKNNTLKVILLHFCNYGKDVHILKCCLHNYSKRIYIILHDQTVSQIISDENLLVRFIVVVGKQHLAAVMQYYLHEELHLLLVGIWSYMLVYTEFGIRYILFFWY